MASRSRVAADPTRRLRPRSSLAGADLHLARSTSADLPTPALTPETPAGRFGLRLRGWLGLDVSPTSFDATAN